MTDKCEDIRQFIEIVVVSLRVSLPISGDQPDSRKGDPQHGCRFCLSLSFFLCMSAKHTHCLLPPHTITHWSVFSHPPHSLYILSTLFFLLSSSLYVDTPSSTFYLFLLSHCFLIDSSAVGWQSLSLFRILSHSLLLSASLLFYPAIFLFSAAVSFDGR